jgi:site-specific recombinase XerC
VLPRRHFIRQGRRLPRDVEDALMQRLFAVIILPRDRAMFVLMLRCGLRVGEVRTLTLQDLYLQPTPGNLPRLWPHGKGGSQRVVYLSAQALVALKAWLAARPNVEDQAVFLTSPIVAFIG